MKLITAFALSTTLVFTPLLHGQTADFSALRSQLQMSGSAVSTLDPASASNVFTYSTQIMIENRARTLGNKLSGSGTRYFAAVDSDLRGLTPQQALQRLSPPPINPGDGVRKVEISIDLQRPLTMEARPGDSVDIGTAVINSGGLQNVEVQSSIFTSGVTVRVK